MALFVQVSEENFHSKTKRHSELNAEIKEHDLRKLFKKANTNILNFLLTGKTEQTKMYINTVTEVKYTGFLFRKLKYIKNCTHIKLEQKNLCYRYCIKPIQS